MFAGGGEGVWIGEWMREEELNKGWGGIEGIAQNFLKKSKKIYFF